MLDEMNQEALQTLFIKLLELMLKITPPRITLMTMDIAIIIPLQIPILNLLVLLTS